MNWFYTFVHHLDKTYLKSFFLLYSHVIYMYTYILFSNGGIISLQGIDTIRISITQRGYLYYTLRLDVFPGQSDMDPVEQPHFDNAHRLRSSRGARKQRIPLVKQITACAKFTKLIVFVCILTRRTFF